MRRVAVTALLLVACNDGVGGGTADEVPTGLEEADAAAPGVYPFQGAWAAENARCDVAGPGSESTPVIITTQSFRDGDIQCRIATVETIDDGQYRVGLRCPEPGGDQQRTQRLSVAAGTLTLTDDDGVRTYRRCESTGLN